jgi:hypothetical protein
VYCDAPGERGTWCVQEGCSREQAAADCQEDIKVVCGRVTEPFFIEYQENSSENCAEVVYCDAPAQERGTWCRQTGCTREQAERDCEQDIAAVCGEVTEPLYFEAR